MNALDTIAVRAEFETGNIKPLLHEIRHALERLTRGEEGSVIDIQSLPLAPGEAERIEEALGQGEVSAELNALGPTTAIETAYPGVWLVTHRNVENEVVARLIEVARIPSILMSQPEDMQAGLAQLERDLEEKPEADEN